METLEDLYRKLGTQVRDLRIDLRLSRPQAAERIGMGHEQLKKIEQGDARTLRSYARCAEGLGGVLVADIVAKPPEASG